MQRGPDTQTTYFIVHAMHMSKPLHAIYYEGESNTNLDVKKIETLLHAAVGTASHQWVISMYCVWRPHCVQL
jgi:hypothetical protein